MKLAELTRKADKEAIDNVTVTIKKAWPHKGGNSPYSYVITDDSGEGRLSIFSKDGAPQLYEGQTYTLTPSFTAKGPQGLMASVYNGKHSINGNQATTIQPAGAAPQAAQGYDEPQFPQGEPAQPQAAPAAYQAPSQISPDNTTAYINEMARVYGLAFKRFKDANVPDEKCHELAIVAFQCAPLYWFNKKSLQNPD